METCLFFIMSFVLVSVSANAWNYGDLGPDIWSDHYPLCSGKSQSPIVVLTACTIYRDFQPLEFTKAHYEKNSFTLKNNGHTIIGTINDDHRRSNFRISGGNLSGTFEFVNFHLHWGENYKSGSEHQV